MNSTPLTLRALTLLGLSLSTTVTIVSASPVDMVDLLERQDPSIKITTHNHRLGCYTDNTNGQRALNADSYGSPNNMTVGNCASFCKRYPIFGLEYGQECWCGDRLGPFSQQVSNAQCSFACSGDATQRCGAGDRLDVYVNGAYKPRLPDVDIPGAPYIGCFVDPGNPRALPNKVVSSGDMTARGCKGVCEGEGYRYFGTEWGRECWCGNVRPSIPAPESECSFGCAGDDDETCGAGLRLTVYGPVGNDVNQSSSVVTARPNLAGFNSSATGSITNLTQTLPPVFITEHPTPTPTPFYHSQNLSITYHIPRAATLLPN